MKNKKRIFALIASTMMIFNLSSCQSSPSFDSSIKNSSTEVHAHKYVEKVIDDKFKALDASCDYPATYYYSCKCGEKGSETFEYGEPLGHDFSAWTYSYRTVEDGTDTRSRRCKRCGKIETQDVYYLNNLYFTVIDEENRYAQVVGYREFFKGDLDTHVIIPERWSDCTVTSIGFNAFKNNETITEVSIPKTVRVISNNAFEGCKNLVKVTIPQDGELKVIEDEAFKNCSSLNCSLICPSSLSLIGTEAFSHTYLSSLTLNEGLENIYKSAFDCSNIKGELIIPKSIKYIEDYSFANNCFTSITIKGIIDSEQKNIFVNNYDLETVIIEEGTEIIGTNMFRNCSKLKNVSIPSSVKEIRSNVFYGCKELSSINLPENLKTIGTSCFLSSGLTSISIPSSVEKIGEYFLGNCSDIISVNVDADNKNYYSVNHNEIIEKDKKRLRFACGDFVVPTDGSVTTIAASSLTSSLTSIVLPSSITAVEDWAFYYCNELKDVYYLAGEEEFKKIAVGENNNPLKKATIHYNYLS